MAHHPPAAPLRTSTWLVPLGLLTLAVIPALGGAMRLASLVRWSPPMGDQARFASHPAALALHIVPALLFAALGALQFSPALRRERPSVHRALGRLLVPSAVLAALTGVVTMAVFPSAPTAGPVLHAMRAASAAALLGFVAQGVLALRRRDYAHHGAWMTRAYALGIAPGVQAFTLAPFAIVGGETRATYALGMAAGWLVSLAVAERSLRRRAPAPRDATGPTMKAVVYERYGAPDELRVTRVRKPTPGPGQVLVRVEATSLNSLDRRMVRADPFLVRLDNGLLRPTKRKILGADFAGIVEAVGHGARLHAVGARVFGESSNEGLGCFAQYVCVRESSAAAVPRGLTANEAASLPLAAATALQALRDRARVAAGQQVLIHGAGGGVGGYLVQIAKAYGAKVTAVCGARSAAAVRALGADEVLDTSQSLPPDRRFDAVFGVNGYRPLREHLARLAPSGTYVMIGGDGRQIFEALVFGALRGNVRVLTMDPARLPQDLAELRDLVERGKLAPLVDEVWPLERVADALRAVESGAVRGKLVLEV